MPWGGWYKSPTPTRTFASFHYNPLINELRGGIAMHRLWIVCGIVALGIVLAVGSPPSAAAADFTIVNIKYEGNNIWVPGTIVVKKGETVKIKAINNVKDDPAEHGLAIEAYGVKQVVNRGKAETVEFKADKAGIFPVTCHLHPAHVGTQLVVLEK
jgi:nitrosocyanin